MTQVELAEKAMKMATEARSPALRRYADGAEWLTRSEVEEIYRLPRTTLARRVRDKAWPAPVRLTEGGRLYWQRAECDARMMAAKAAGAAADAA